MSPRFVFGVSSVVAVAAAAVVATACGAAGSDDAGGAADEVVGARPSALGAVVSLENGCSAVKVGPKQLLIAARCVTNRPAYAIGKTIRFRAVNVEVETTTSAGAGAGDAAADAHEAAAPSPPAGDAGDAGAPAPTATDAGSADAAASDAGASSDAGDASAPGAFEATIAQVSIHSSFLSKCGTGACLPGKPGIAEVADVAVIVTSREIENLAIAPIDLDPVVPGDKVLVSSYGCDATAATAKNLRARATSAVGSEALIHPGSPFETAVDQARILPTSYTVTRGPGSSAAGEAALGICSDRDIGAPMFRADGTALVGVGSAVTIATGARLPTTNQHARLDAKSKNAVGGWLSQLGVKTTKSCSLNDAAPCPKEPEAPPIVEAEAGSDAEAPTQPSTTTEPGETGETPPTGSSRASSGSEGESETPVTSKKKKAADSGCSAAPGSTSSGTAGALGLVLAAALVLRARRRR